MNIKILGPMTKPVELLLHNTALAAKKLKLKASFEKIHDFRKLVSYGAMSIPALVIDEKLISAGSVLNVEEAMAILKQLM